ncbi:MAG: hypothetical protein ACTSRK_05875 [Promethearchaeota archaeon]
MNIDDAIDVVIDALSEYLTCFARIEVEWWMIAGLKKKLFGLAIHYEPTVPE